jgi:hypothetical protein
MMLIVFLQQEVDVFVNQPFHVPHGVCRNATISRHSDRVQPELALSVCAANMNVRRLGALVRVKVETKTTDSKHCRHSLSVLPPRDTGKFGGVGVGR